MARSARTGDDTGDDTFMRFAAAVGDLRNPFYEEERQRDVWNEASAVGFQLTLWLGLVAANLMIWIGGAPGLPYALATFAIVALAALVVVSYAHRLGVDAEEPERLRRPALIPATGLVVAFFMGVLLSWDWPSDGFLGGFRDGMVIGGALGAAAAVAALVWEALRRRRPTAPKA